MGCILGIDLCPELTLLLLAADNVKNRIMADRLRSPRYMNARHAFKTILHENDQVSRTKLGNLLAGGKNFYRVRIAEDWRAGDRAKSDSH